MALAFVPGAHILLFGAGYIGEALCTHLSSVDCSITRVTRTQSHTAELKQSGKQAICFSDVPAVLNALQSTTHLLVTSPPSSDGIDPILSLHGKQIAQATHLQWKCYLSSTSVYADAKGGEVDENFPTDPVSPSGHARLSSERGWLALPDSPDILRLAGVYGPGRSALHTLRRDASSLARARSAGDVLVSRIFVDDIVSTICAAARRANAGGDIFNVADDMPATRAQVFECARRLLECADETVAVCSVDDDKLVVANGRDRYRTSKRVLNRKIKDVLNISLKFPTYMHGLAHLAVQEGILGGMVKSN